MISSILHTVYLAVDVLLDQHQELDVEYVVEMEYVEFPTSASEESRVLSILQAIFLDGTLYEQLWTSVVEEQRRRR